MENSINLQIIDTTLALRGMTLKPPAMLADKVVARLKHIAMPLEGYGLEALCDAALAEMKLLDLGGELGAIHLFPPQFSKYVVDADVPPGFAIPGMLPTQAREAYRKAVHAISERMLIKIWGQDHYFAPWHIQPAD